MTPTASVARLGQHGKGGEPAGSRRGGGTLLLALILAVAGARAPAAEGGAEALRGRWTSAEGDVIVFELQGNAAVGFLVEASAHGLGRFFAAGSPILHQVTWADGKLACTLAEGQLKTGEDPTGRTADYTVVGGPAEAAAAGDGAEIVLRWQPIQRRHYINEDGWFERAEETEVQPPAVTLTLRRGPRLSLFLVRGDELEPAVALFHGLPYVAEFTTNDPRLPLTLQLVLAVGEERFPLEVAAISDGAERRYRSKPFLLRPWSDGLPSP